MKRLFIFLCTISLTLIPVTAKAVTLDDFKINGFLTFEYEKADGPGHPVTPAGDEKGSFDQMHFNLLMEFPVNERLNVKGHVEYEHGPIHKSSSQQGDIAIEWAYFEYTFSNNMRIRGGSFLTPFGIYNEIHDASTAFNSVRIPFGIYKADKVGGFTMFPKYSTGINLLGRYYTEGEIHIDYSLYITNGENSVNNPAEKDDNSNKAIGGKIMVAPLSGLVIGGSLFKGQKGTAEEDHTSWAGTISYSANHLDIKAEYASSELDNTTETAWYSALSYRINTFTPYTRYGIFDPDTDMNNDKWTEIVYGINYELMPNFIFKIENRHFSGEAGNSKVSEDYNEMAASISVAF